MALATGESRRFARRARDVGFGELAERDTRGEVFALIRGDRSQITATLERDITLTRNLLSWRSLPGLQMRRHADRPDPKKTWFSALDIPYRWNQSRLLAFWSLGCVPLGNLKLHARWSFSS